MTALPVRRTLNPHKTPKRREAQGVYKINTMDPRKHGKQLRVIDDDDLAKESFSSLYCHHFICKDHRYQFCFKKMISSQKFTTAVRIELQME